MLSVEGISVQFGGVRALDEVSLEAKPSRVTGLIGPNGAGKTTLFNVVSGLQRPNTGRVLLRERDITALDPGQRARLGIARTFQRLEIFTSMTTRDNVLVAAELHRSRAPDGKDPETITTEILERLRLERVAGVQAGTLPTGLARLVELARSLATHPAVLLLDEPASGLSTTETEELGEVISQLAASGMAVLLVEHDIELVMAVCTDVFVLDGGRVIAVDTPAAVQADPKVRLAYLGTEVTTERAPGGDDPAVTDPGGAEPAGVDPGGAEPAGAAEPVVADPGGAVEPVAVEPGAVPVRVRPPAAGAGGVAIHTGPSVGLSGVTAAYGGIQVLHGIDLKVEGGTVFALLGPNGAGKSTLIKVVAGRMSATGGRITVGDEDVTSRPAGRRARSGVCCVPEGRAVFPNLTVAENLQMWTFRSRGVTRRAVEDQAYSRFPILGQRRQQLAGTLSGGEQQMLAMSRALTTNPSVLLLDEISMGLAPMIVAELYSVVAQLAAGGITILLAEQFARTALTVADRAGIMAHGRIVSTGTPDEVSGLLAGAYLGASDPG